MGETGPALTAQETFLKEEMALAGSPKPYLVLDPVQATLTLRCRHVDLLTWPVTATVSHSRLAGSRALEWPAFRFDLVSELQLPERPRVRPGSGEEGNRASPQGPQTVEAIQAVRDRFLQDLPARFRLTFEPDLDLVVQGESGPRNLAERARAAGRRLAEPWRALAGRMAGRRGENLELRLVMSPAEARRLHLALEPGIALLVVPPQADPQADPPLSSR